MIYEEEGKVQNTSTNVDRGSTKGGRRGRDAGRRNAKVKKEDGDEQQKVPQPLSPTEITPCNGEDVLEARLVALDRQLLAGVEFSQLLFSRHIRDIVLQAFLAAVRHTLTAEA